MREIKFRAWDKQHNMMVRDFKLGPYPEPSLDANGILCRSTWYLFMQFTGLHDKNGREIFEGDILTTRTFKNVEGKSVEICAPIKWTKGGYLLDGSLVPVTYAEEMMEIIGNIYDNPELLGSGLETATNISHS